jgi:hypothetical protein
MRIADKDLFLPNHSNREIVTMRVVKSIKNTIQKDPIRCVLAMVVRLRNKMFMIREY